MSKKHEISMFDQILEEKKENFRFRSNFGKKHKISSFDQILEKNAKFQVLINF